MEFRQNLTILGKNGDLTKREEERENLRARLCEKQQRNRKETGGKRGEAPIRKDRSAVGARAGERWENCAKIREASVISTGQRSIFCEREKFTGKSAKGGRRFCAKQQFSAFLGITL